jgi:hypothetical protein
VVVQEVQLLQEVVEALEVAEVVRLFVFMEVVVKSQLEHQSQLLLVFVIPQTQQLFLKMEWCRWWMVWWLRR